ncbi:hypothetical protein Patl1_35337 [Pistacia atlantica]|nr:hypothetical protein Patl1_35337 [Pistacia atlantica]
MEAGVRDGGRGARSRASIANLLEFQESADQWFATIYPHSNVNIESPPSMHPCKRLCDMTGYEAPYYDPRTNLRYSNAEVFKLVRSLPSEYVQRYLALRNAAVVLK